MKRMRRFSVILPTYNEAENIKELIPLLFSKLGEYNLEVVVVDDNSPDKTWKVALDLAKKYNVKVIRRPKKLGLASAILEGIYNASNDICVVMDADFQHRVEDIPKLIEPIIKEDYDLVVGSRYIEEAEEEGLNAFRKLVSLTAKKLANWLLGVKVKDPMSGFFAINREKIYYQTKWTLVGYKALLEILVRFPDLKVKEVPIKFEKRRYGRSKFNWREVIDYLSFLILLRFNK